MTGAQAAILSWYPMGDANPVRFYQLRLTFNMLKGVPGPGANSGTGPSNDLVPAMY